ncbi:MAG TPA: QsdR family transcriptional regulator [Jiangellales bacterium]|nr:QsdR family transcriptional regulator [Jiangellales bacterium]
MDRRVIDYPLALAAARRRFVATGQLPMDSLADDLWVSRATLYRVVGSRDRLFGDVLWQLARRTLDIAIQDAAAAGLVGVDRLINISSRFNEQVAGFAPMQRFLRDEPADAVQILFASTARVHERAVRAWARLFRQALKSGELESLPFDVDETAYVFVRIGESLLYGNMLAGIVPDTRLGEHLRRAILAP